jgi:WhiB family redox-sensing transcriptional regulator
VVPDATIVGVLDSLAVLAYRPWEADALCREHPEVNFFPERGEDLRPAKELCARCLVSEECLTAGMGEHHGVWAGTSERERRRLRVEQGLVVVGTDRGEAA